MVDKGYTDAQELVSSQRDYGITLIGPVSNDPSWQARENEGYDKSQFHFDWERQVATCPSGKQSLSWLKSTYPQNGTVWEVRFSRKDCTPCVNRSHCTRSKKEPRIVGLQSREHHEALQQARVNQNTEAFQKQYAARAGIEATHGQAVRRSGLRHSRYIGLDKTRLQHLATAAATNLVRLGEWLMGTPKAQTRCSPFAALQVAA